MSTSLNAVKVGLLAKLQADATLPSLLSGGSASIFDAPAPEGQDAPYVVFQKMTGVPARTFGTRAWDDTVFMVKGITQGPSKATGGSIAERIDAALDLQTLTISGATNLYLGRDQDIEYVEVDRGIQYFHCGATYRIWTS